jgi:crossover junction endodeoxyribonuclease RusA
VTTVGVRGPLQPYGIPRIGGGLPGLDTGLRVISFMVLGHPVTQGSKDAYPVWKGSPCPACKRRAFSHSQLVESAAGWQEWRLRVETAGRRAMRQLGAIEPPLDGPLAAAMTFTLARPPSHRGRTEPTGPPDEDKLARAAGDACTAAGVIADDARILGYTRQWKAFPLLAGMEARPWFDDDVLDQAGAVIRIWQITP